MSKKLSNTVAPSSFTGATGDTTANQRYYHEGTTFFRLGITNIQDAIKAAQQTGEQVKFAPFPDDRNINETIWCPLPNSDDSASEVAKWQGHMLEKTMAIVKESDIYKKSQTPGAILGGEDLREFVKITTDAAHRQFYIEDTNTPQPVCAYRLPYFDGGRKTQHLENWEADLGNNARYLAAKIKEEQVLRLNNSTEGRKEVHRELNMDPEIKPFTHLSQCETISIFQGIVTQMALNELLGEENAPQIHYMVNASDYRTPPGEYVEHSALYATDPTGKEIIAHIDGSGAMISNMGLFGAQPGRQVCTSIYDITTQDFTSGQKPISITGGDGRQVAYHSNHVLTDDNVLTLDGAMRRQIEQTQQLQN